MSNKSQRVDLYNLNKKLASTRDNALILVSCLVIGLLVLVYGVVLASDLIRARQFLLQGQNNLQLAYQEAEKVDPSKALQYFKEARDDFTNASKALNSPSVSVLDPAPAVNKNMLALKKLASIGLEITHVGELLTQASMKFLKKNGKPTFGFNNGQIDFQSFIAARPYVDQANLHILMATAEYEKIPSGGLVSPIKRACDEVGDRLSELKNLTANTKKSLDLLPGVLGANSKRRYFLAVQNNAELRATGGLIGSYGIISVDKGKLALEVFDDIHRLERVDQKPVAASKDYISRYGSFKGTSMWLNVNMSPDFPTVGRLLVELYKSVKGEDLDGVISMDPVALKYILNAIGPVKVPGRTVGIDANNAIDWTLIKAYEEYPENRERKNFLADVAKAVWEHIVAGQIKDKSKLIDQLGLSLSEKHMAFFSMNGQEQKLAESLGYAGAMLPTADDYLQVVTQNHGGNKVDIYLHQNINYSVSLNPDGSALARLSVKVSNDAPPTGLPPYVAGENPLGAKNGYSNSWLNVYVPKGTQLLATKGNESDGEVEVGCEKDKTVFSQYLEIAPGTSKTVEFTYELPYVLATKRNQLIYSLDWQVQPVINKPNITFSVKLPRGFEFGQLPEGIKRKGKTVSYSSVLMKDERFDFSLIDNR